MRRPSAVPTGLMRAATTHPALKCWAIVMRCLRHAKHNLRRLRRNRPPQQNLWVVWGSQQPKAGENAAICEGFRCFWVPRIPVSETQGCPQPGYSGRRSGLPSCSARSDLQKTLWKRALSSCLRTPEPCLPKSRGLGQSPSSPTDSAEEPEKQAPIWSSGYSSAFLML